MKRRRSRQSRSSRRTSAHMIQALESRHLLAASIAFEFAEQEVRPNNNGLAPSHVAGVVPQGNWNNLRNASGSAPVGLSKIKDNTGGATDVNIAFSSNITWQIDHATGVFPAAGDEEMANSALAGTIQNGTEQGKIPITITNIPYAKYDVYVYVPSDNGFSYIDIHANDRVLYGVSQDNSANIDGNPNTAFPWVPITGTNPDTLQANGRNNGNYAKFSGMTGATLNLNVEGGASLPNFPGPYNTTISGIQIVEVPIVSGSIGLEFAAQEVRPNNNGLNPTHIAGLVPQGNWNNIRNASGTEPQAGGLTSIVDATGTATNVSVMFSSYITWHIDYTTEIEPAAGDEEMANSALLGLSQNGNQGKVPITISNIPYAKYNVYVYVPSDNTYSYVDIHANDRVLYGVAQNNVADIDGNPNTAFPWVRINGTDVSTTATNGRNNGNYALFTGMSGSTLNISVEGGANPPVFPGPYNTSISGIQIVELPPGTGSISGNVFNDKGSNGVIDPIDTPVAGWSVYLDANNNGTLDPGEAATTTDASGDYLFAGLADGTYHVKQVLQTGYRKTLPGSGIPGYDVVVAGGNAVTGKNFGDTTNLFLAGTAYNDANNNGVQDNGEAGIAGVTVDIVSNSIVVATRTTDASGKWQVKGLSQGTGEAVAIVPTGYTATFPANAKYIGSATSGQQIGNLNFGFRVTPVAPAPSLFAQNAILEGVATDIDLSLADIIA